jgi:uncharacterized FAD-dependent dehydrogenase
MSKDFDVVIIGAGQAGMFAAYELAKADKGLKIVLIDKGQDIAGRTYNGGDKTKPTDIMCGMGGAGTWSDGTLNLRPDIGGDLDLLTHDNAKSWKLIKYVDEIFLKHGAPEHLYHADSQGAEDLKRKAASVGVEFIEIDQRHIGSDNAPKVIGSFEKELCDLGVELMMETEVEDLITNDNICTGVILKGGKKINAKYVLAAPGRIGGEWIDDVFTKHHVDYNYGPLDVGVRVEVPSIVMDPIIKINRDPKFRIQTKKYDDAVRTFCVNHKGFVVKEEYDGHIGVNGHSLKNKESENTNFAFLQRIELTEPLENTTKYGKSIGKLATTIGGGKPIVQRMRDLLNGKRSTVSRIKKNRIVPTLEDATPGDISMAMPHRIVMNIIEGLEKLNEVIPGVLSDSTLIYGPEIKFYATMTKVDDNMETSVKNLFAAGDGCGLSRDITNAAATGILAAEGILSKL